jgi:CubicO group peptidase (beta-lactamase class C family)
MNTYPLPTATLESAGISPEHIGRLATFIDKQIADGHYPGAQIALARHGKLLLDRSFGNARQGAKPQAAASDTLWLLYSNTKVVFATAMWQLLEQGVISFDDKVSDHLPDFARHGKRDITLMQVITHQGGFPSAAMPKEGWLDHAAMRRAVCDFALEWTPGSKVVYHGLSAHWVMAAVMEAVTGRDFREVVRDNVLTPLGLAGEITVGLRPADDARAADMHEPVAGGGVRVLADTDNDTWKRAGAPGGGGYGTARGMVALYQTMLAGGTLGGARVLSPRTIQFALRNRTGDRVDEYMGMPMHRALGPHLRGLTNNVRGMGALAAPETFGHGGVGSSYCWADPTSGVSFAYITNCRIPDPWHSQRLDKVSNFVHTAIVG